VPELVPIRTIDLSNEPKQEDRLFGRRRSDRSARSRTITVAPPTEKGVVSQALSANCSLRSTYGIGRDRPGAETLHELARESVDLVVADHIRCGR